MAWKCRTCKRKFPTHKDLKQHEQEHERKVTE